jgi:hypothetical protein
MVNTAVIAQQFRWAYDGVEFDQNLWHDKEGNAAEYLSDVRANTRKIFDETDVFIITLGLSEVWYDKITGEVFWRAVPADAFDPARHGFRVSTVAENEENLNVIVDLVKRHRPDAKIVFTLSPVPLVATFRPVSCVSANTVSKAVLRVALDQMIAKRSGDGSLFYFPSYELVTRYFREPYELDNRHVRPAVVETIMESFVRHYVG